LRKGLASSQNVDEKGAGGDRQEQRRGLGRALDEAPCIRLEKPATPLTNFWKTLFGAERQLRPIARQRKKGHAQNKGRWERQTVRNNEGTPSAIIRQATTRPMGLTEGENGPGLRSQKKAQGDKKKRRGPRKRCNDARLNARVEGWSGRGKRPGTGGGVPGDFAKKKI